MAVTATKKSELVLSEEVRKLYDECWNILNNSLKNLKINSGFVYEIKDPYKFNSLIANDVIYVKIERQVLVEKLNQIFVDKNALPKEINNDSDMAVLFSYINKHFGKNFDPSVAELGSEWREWYRSYFTYKGGEQTIAATRIIFHEFDHIDAEYGSTKTREVFFNRSRKLHRSSKWREHVRYDEGRAVFSEIKVMDSKDDALRAYCALALLYRMAEPGPQFYSERGDKFMAPDSRRYSEGFKDYYMLRHDVGEKNLERLEGECAKKGLFIGINKEGHLTVIKPWGLFSSFEVDTEKLKADFKDLEELKIEKPSRSFFHRKLD